MKIALLSDAPDGTTGLGRITRELAQQIHAHMPDVDLATIGYRAHGSRRFPWQQYSINEVEPAIEWLKIFEDWAGKDERWYLIPITPPSWIFGLLHPQELATDNQSLIPLGVYLEKSNIKIAPYLAIESLNYGERLGSMTQSIVRRCHDVAFYNKLGADACQQTIGGHYGFIHHGFHWESFQNPRPDAIAKARAVLDPKFDKKIIGCVMTNQYRKNFGLLFAIARELQDRGKKFTLWIHTDKEVGYWNLHQLKTDCGVRDENLYITYISPRVTDRDLSEMYSACDVTALPSQGEGFGYPVVESMACGTPCIVGTFGGQRELVPLELTAPTKSLDQDGFHGLLVPNYRATDWARQIVRAANKNRRCKNFLDLKEHARQWDWSSQWGKFEKWLRDLDR